MGVNLAVHSDSVLSVAMFPGGDRTITGIWDIQVLMIKEWTVDHTDILQPDAERYAKGLVDNGYRSARELVSQSVTRDQDKLLDDLIREAYNRSTLKDALHKAAQ